MPQVIDSDQLLAAAPLAGGAAPLDGLRATGLQTPGGGGTTGQLIVASAPGPGSGVALNASGALPTNIPGVAGQPPFVTSFFAGTTSIPQVANQAVLLAATVPSAFTPMTFQFRITVGGGNIDCGIYVFDGTDYQVLWSLGSTANPGVGSASIDIAAGAPDALALAAGAVFLAYASSAGADIGGVATANVLPGFGFTAPTSFPLPDTILGSAVSNLTGNFPWLVLFP